MLHLTCAFHSFSLLTTLSTTGQRRLYTYVNPSLPLPLALSIFLFFPACSELSHLSFYPLFHFFGIALFLLLLPFFVVLTFHSRQSSFLTYLFSFLNCFSLQLFFLSTQVVLKYALMLLLNVYVYLVMLSKAQNSSLFSQLFTICLVNCVT